MHVALKSEKNVIFRRVVFDTFWSGICRVKKNLKKKQSCNNSTNKHFCYCTIFQFFIPNCADKVKVVTSFFGNFFFVLFWYGNTTFKLGCQIFLFTLFPPNSFNVKFRLNWEKMAEQVNIIIEHSRLDCTVFSKITKKIIASKQNSTFFKIVIERNFGNRATTH